MSAINHEKHLEWFETRCDRCGEIRQCAMGELSGLMLCAEDYDQAEGEVAVDMEMGCI
jgi:formylmethanofuran dehydrogenase subunit E